MKRFWIVAVSVLLQACASGPPIVAVPPPASPPPPPPRIPVRDFIAAGQTTDPRFGAYAYVVFTSPLAASAPDSNEKRQRYESFCRAYVDGLVDSSEMTSLNPRNLLVTYWMLRSGANQTDDCSAMVNTYDYGTAAALAAGAGKSGTNGPLLIALTRPFVAGQTVTRPRIVMDLSGLSPETFTFVLTEWRGRLALDPSKWSNGFTLADTRLALHSVLTRYGQQILEVVQPND